MRFGESKMALEMPMLPIDSAMYRKVVPRSVVAILFDIGGVLTPDPWETIICTPKRGLAARIGVPAERLSPHATAMWAKYAPQQTEERAYWEELAKLSGVAIPADLATSVQDELIVANAGARDVLRKARELGIRIGIVSDNTTFWYRRQASLLGIEDLVDASLVFLSFEQGLRKSTKHGGLYSQVARSVDAPNALVVDDRLENLTIARELGFQTFYCVRQPESDATAGLEQPQPLVSITDLLLAFRGQ